MQSADAYAVLAKELEDLRSVPLADLMPLLDGPPATRSFLMGGELVDLETSLTWADIAHTAIVATAHLRGPSTWHHQHMQESIRIVVPAGAAVGA